MSEIFKRTRSGKPYVEASSRIKGCENTKFKEKYNLTNKTLPVYYADMLLPITKKYMVRN